MTVLFNNFESPTSGTTLTTGNTSNGDGSSAFDGITIPASGVLITDTTHVIHGNALKVSTGATASQVFANWNSSTAPFTSANGTIWGRIYCYFTANPGAAFPVVQLLDSGTNFGGRVTINTSGKVVMNFGGSNGVATTSTSAIPLNAWFRLEFKLVCSNTVGQTEVKIFSTTPDGTTADETNTSAASLDTTITACQGARIGMCANTANQGPAWLDAFAISNTGYPGPFATTVSVSGTVANITMGALTGALIIGKNLTGSVAGVALAAPTGALVLGKNLTGTLTSITVAAPLGSVSAGGGAPSPYTGLGALVNITLAALSGQVVIIPHAHLFRTPTIKLRPADPQGERLWLYYGNDTGISVIKRQDGTYYQTQYPTTDEINEALVAYIGGHEYVVDDTEYTALVAAGYLPYFAPSNPDGTYGGGAYGGGGFG